MRRVLGEVTAIYLSADFESNLALYLGVLGGLCELAFLLWLLVMGVGRRAPDMLVTVERSGLHEIQSA
jgi:hypothetical protein